MNLGLLGLPSNERSYGPAHDTQSPEQGGGCRCLPNLLDRLWFSLHQLRFCPPKPIAWNRCGVFSPPRPAPRPPLSSSHSSRHARRVAAHTVVGPCPVRTAPRCTARFPPAACAPSYLRLC